METISGISYSWVPGFIGWELIWRGFFCRSTGSVWERAGAEIGATMA